MCHTWKGFLALALAASGALAGAGCLAEEALAPPPLPESSPPGSLTKRPTSDPLQTEGGPLAVLNEAFRQVYLSAKQDILSRTDPVIILLGDKLVLTSNGARQEATFIEPAYNVLKSVDHLPLALFVILVNHTGDSLPQSVKDRLKQMRDLAGPARSAVAESQLSAGQKERQTSLIDRSLAFLDAVLAEGSLTPKRLAQFARGLAPDILRNVDDACALELAAIDRIIAGWKANMSESEWQKAHFIVVDGHMARNDNRHMQYFLALTGEQNEGERVIYMEGAEEEFKALDLIVTHILDKSIGESFFRDPWRMHRDLLSDGARLYLKNHPPGR